MIDIRLAVCTLFLAIAAVMNCSTAYARPDQTLRTVSIERIKIHGISLEGNLEGNDARREV